MAEICVGCGRETSRYQIIPVEGKPALKLCHYCYKHPSDRKLTTFPFTTSHFDGKERTVNSLHHLRKLEREHNTQSVCYNMNERNHDDAPQQRFPSREEGRGVEGGHGQR